MNVSPLGFPEFSPSRPNPGQGGRMGPKLRTGGVKSGRGGHLRSPRNRRKFGAGAIGIRIMAYDIVIRGGRVIDGTGAPERIADVAIAGDRIVGIGKVSGAARETDRCRRDDRRAGLRRHSHALRCAGVLGSCAQPVLVSWHHDGRVRQLRLQHRATDAAIRPTAIISCACWRGSKACQSKAWLRACRGTGTPSANILRRWTARWR